MTTTAELDTIDRIDPAAVAARLGGRSVVLVGLMGSGKTTVGRRLAQLLDLPFADSDHEIEAASRMTVAELFDTYGEPEFRALETRVVTRLAAEGPRVLATGGGAFMSAAIREALRTHGVSVWLRADLDTLMERVGRRGDRPLLRAPDPRAVMAGLIEKRYPTYATADLTVESRNVRRETVAAEIVSALARHLGSASGPEAGGRRP